ncbi:hypothetical protein GCG54_00014708 [Colletotrichum gloeosporioides]|uniref:Uncharacterized protein n=1 Tax=Colletotrichum gloeosporioides TaxID=474922 RepID=A0A8H4CCU1_COLGL|nr:uncharacterized protein GCG54_00014708 [Colletotrichum gloeosporioides]KAF3801494.1 hypothetical protein GCG54_00014708 [Colletotrichum gloeosporioides]
MDSPFAWPSNQIGLAVTSTETADTLTKSHASLVGAPANVLGAAHNRFVVVSTLLSLIDRVRGEPTTHSLDRHPHDDSWKHEQLQKKFLDSFALISSTSRVGRETAAAVCLEQGHPSGTVLRLARNLGVPSSLIIHLQEILDDLTAVALKERRSKDVETKILLKVINLTQDKIWSLLEQLSDEDVRAAVERSISEMDEDDLESGDAEEIGFRQWVLKLRLLTTLDPKSDPSQLIMHIKWASKARWTYSEQLESFFGTEKEELPEWLQHIYKLGRYYVATKAMLKLASKQPDVFTSIHVEPVEAPEQVKFTLGNQRDPLLTVLKKITTADPVELRDKLGQTWFTADPEKKLRQACHMTLTVHAEMQLLSFYDHHPHLTPRLLFMGTSKKACYLCHEFISRHPLTIGVSASHQKLYPTWLPAPCSSAVRKKHKALLWEFSRHLEQTTARDLETRLGIRRPISKDSTAGPSLTTSWTDSIGSWTQELSLRGPRRFSVDTAEVSERCSTD